MKFILKKERVKTERYKVYFVKSYVFCLVLTSMATENCTGPLSTNDAYRAIDCTSLLLVQYVVLTSPSERPVTLEHNFGIF